MKTYKSEYGVKIFAYVISILTAIICFIPFWLIVIGSFTAESEVIRNGFAFWPKDFSMESYRMVFKVPEKIFRSYGITILITAVGTGLSLFLTTMAAFVSCVRILNTGTRLPCSFISRPSSAAVFFPAIC